MNATDFDIVEFSESDQRILDILLLDKNGRMLPVPAATLQAIPIKQLRAWASQRGRYNLPTLELLAWLRERIGKRGAIEIGAGMGDLGYRLGIPMTDSYQQVEDPVTKSYMAIVNQVTTKPPADVVKMEGQTAVNRIKPEVVLAAWVTQRWLPGESEGNQLGPREDHILKDCSEYIFIGNENIHGTKRIMALPHETFHFPWLVSRARDQSKNVIYVWKGQR